jgi:hypothetical protein
MSGLMEDYGGAPESEARCYRDYESEIAKLKGTLASLNEFKDSLEKFLERTKQGRRNMETKFTFPELYGILTFDIKDYNERLKRVIAEWDVEIAKKRTKETA